MPDGLFNFNSGFGTTGTKSLQQQIDEQTALGDAWLNSGVGQKWNAAQESAATQARRVADAQLDNAKRKLNLEVATLKQQGRFAEAELKLKQGDAELAKQRFAWEQQIKQQEFGLQRAEAYTKWSSTPDQYWSQQDFRGALSNAMRGVGPQPIAQTVANVGGPQMKGYADFDAIAGPNGSLANAGNGGRPSPAMDSATAGSGSGTDPRYSAASAVMKALPPSSDTGLDDNDMAALRAVESIYLARQPGSLDRLGPARRKIAQTGLARLGYDPALMEEEYQKSLPGQGSTRAA